MTQPLQDVGLPPVFIDIAPGDLHLFKDDRLLQALVPCLVNDSAAAGPDLAVDDISIADLTHGLPAAGASPGCRTGHTLSARNRLSPVGVLPVRAAKGSILPLPARCRLSSVGVLPVRAGLSVFSSLRIRAGPSIILTLHPVYLAASAVFACIRETKNRELHIPEV